MRAIIRLQGAKSSQFVTVTLIPNGRDDRLDLRHYAYLFPDGQANEIFHTDRLSIALVNGALVRIEAVGGHRDGHMLHPMTYNGVNLGTVRPKTTMSCYAPESHLGLLVINGYPLAMDIRFIEDKTT